jgi:predicted aspartyl protease
MVSAKNSAMGRFAVEIELANNEDVVGFRRGRVPAEQVRRLTLRGVVDSGAARLVIPQATAEKLGLPMAGRAGVRYADGRVVERPLADEVRLTWGGCSGVHSAIVEPDRDSALIGAIALEDLDLTVDCTHPTLAPRDPKQIISEVE